MSSLSLLLALALHADAPAASATVELEPPPAFRLHVGGQVGFPFILGVSAVGTFFPARKARFDVEATWEPSASLQSYSLAGAYHVADSIFFVGPRFRLVQFQPPWARGTVQLFGGLGLDLGVRVRVGPSDKGVVCVALGVTYLPGQATNLQTLLGLTAGFSWSVFER